MFQLVTIPFGVEHVKRVIRHAADQQAELVFAGIERHVSLVPFGNVAGDLGEADQFAVFVNGIDDDGGEKPGSILALAPAFGLELSVLPGRLQGLRRHSRVTIRRQVKHPEMPADGFRGLIALDASGPGIPVGDDAVGIEHIDGVINHPLPPAGGICARSRTSCAEGCLFEPFKSLPQSTATRYNTRIRFRFHAIDSLIARSIGSIAARLCKV